MPDLSPPELPQAPSIATTSLAARLTNVFVVPGEVFDEVRAGPPSTANWLVPALLSCVAAVVFSLVVFSQDRIVYALREAQEKQIQKMVDSGKLPKEQAEAAVNALGRFVTPTLLTIFGAVGGIVASFAQLFLGALLLWLIGTKAFQAQFDYMRAVEVCGLASMIGVVGMVVSMFLVVILGNLQASPGPILLVHEVDPSNKLHRLLASVNVMTLWYVGVVAVGLARLAQASFSRAAIWVYGAWAGITLVLLLPGWGR